MPANVHVAIPPAYPWQSTKQYVLQARLKHDYPVIIEQTSSVTHASAGNGEPRRPAFALRFKISDSQLN